MSTSGDFNKYLLDNEILSQLSTPSMPQHNDLAERINQTLLEMVRSMMSNFDLQKLLWGSALETTAYILNKVPTKSVPKNVVELWARHKPRLQHYKI